MKNNLWWLNVKDPWQIGKKVFTVREIEEGFVYFAEVGSSSIVYEVIEKIENVKPPKYIKLKQNMDYRVFDDELLYERIHQAIKKRVEAQTSITDKDIIKMINDYLDEEENNPL